MSKKSTALVITVCVFAAMIMVCGWLYMYSDGDLSNLFKSDLYRRYEHYAGMYGYDTYKEVDYKCTDYEAEIGNAVMDRLIEVGNYSGLEEEADIDRAGAMDRFFYFQRKDTVRQDFTAEFVTCKITGDEGHVWVIYSQEGYDENGDLAHGSWRCLLLLCIEKQGDEWQVVRVVDGP